MRHKNDQLRHGVSKFVTPWCGNLAKHVNLASEIDGSNLARSML